MRWSLGIRRYVLAALVAAACSGIGFQDASAQTRWVMDGAGCVPTGLAIQSNQYIIVAGRIKFLDPAVGSITVICPVAANVGFVNSIGVSYRDSTGIGTSSRVRAALRRINKFTGAVTTVPGMNFSSDARPDYRDEKGYSFSWATGAPQTLDDFNYYYFVQATLTRTSSSEIVEFGGAELLYIVQ